MAMITIAVSSRSGDADSPHAGNRPAADSVIPYFEVPLWRRTTESTTVDSIPAPR